jgi:hypothetical protein
LWVLLVLMGSCASTPWQVRYLTSAEGTATQEQVTQHLGGPMAKLPLEDGGEMWTYRYTRGDVRVATFECWDYKLTFDAQQVLRQWKHRPCRLAVQGYDPERDKLEFLQAPDRP